MEKAEALEFIGLKEPLNEAILLSKYNERFNYFEMLYTNAPNRVIEKIQQQNLEKLKQVKGILLEDITSKKESFNRFSTPFVMAKRDCELIEKRKVLGWLIIRTENKSIETFDLFEGINYLGRKKKEEERNNIVILDDPFISRTHAFIKCMETAGILQFQLIDGDGIKPSVNGIFVNGNETKIDSVFILVDNDTIQIGRTKLVFKVKKDNRTLSGVIEEVVKNGFVKTIDL